MVAGIVRRQAATFEFSAFIEFDGEIVASDGMKESAAAAGHALYHLVFGKEAELELAAGIEVGHRTFRRTQRAASRAVQAEQERVVRQHRVLRPSV